MKKLICIVQLLFVSIVCTAQEVDIKQLTEQANQGDPAAQCTLGVCYAHGHGVIQDYSKAVYWFQKSAEQGNAVAFCLLGACYADGAGVSQDDSQAIYWYLKSANKGFAGAQSILGECYYRGNGVSQDFKKAYEYLLKASDAGNMFGKALLGEMYYKGDYVSKDYNKAFLLFQEAATDKNSPSAHAMRMLSACYRYGLGTKIDAEKEKYWMEEAAKHKDDKAMMIAANFQKVPKNEKEPQNSFAQYSEKGWAAWTNEDYEMSKDLFAKGADMGDIESMGGLAYVYLSGALREGRDIQKAKYWAQKGYVGGNRFAAAVIGLIYCHSDNNYKEARPYLLFAYQNGFKSSHLANLISASYIVEGNRESAKKWANDVYNIEKSHILDLEDFADACSLLAKLAMDDKDYYSAMHYAEESKKAILNDKAPFNPLSFYVLGRSQLSLNVYPEQGRQNVKYAANNEYNYYFIIQAFKDEIYQYWESIK